MAKIIKPIKKRVRITFYLPVAEAQQLERLKQQAANHGGSVCFRDDFIKWFRLQLAQVEKDLKALEKSREKKGVDNG